MAVANDDQPDCANCPHRTPNQGVTKRNAEAIEIWKQLDLFARGIDGFSGVPMTLRIEGIDSECAKRADPDATRWRVMLLEEKIYDMRIKKWKAEREKKT